MTSSTNRCSRRPLLAVTAAVAAVAGLLLLAPRHAAPPPVALDPRQPTPVAGDRTDAMRVHRQSFACGTQAPAAYAAPAGSELAFDLEGRFHSCIRREAVPGQQELGYTVKGQLVVRVLARRDAEILAGIRFPGLVVVVTATGGRADPRAGDSIAADLGHETIVHMTDAGQTLGYRFPAPMAAENRSWVRSLWSSFRFVRPAAAGAGWTLEETDATGPHTVRYSRTATPAPALEHLTRQKIAYRHDEADAAKPRFDVTGSSTGLLCRELGWLRSADVAEEIGSVVAEVGLRVTLTAAASLRLARSARFAARPEIDWESPWSPLDGGADAKLTGAQREAERWCTLLDGVRFEDLCAEITQLVLSGRVDSRELYEARQKLAWLLRLKPEAVAALAGQIRGLATDVVPVVLAAAGSAGTSAAQALLASLASDASLGEPSRFASLQAMFQLRAPSHEVNSVVRALAEDAAAPRALRACSLLLLGALASRPDAATPALVERVLGLEAQARRDGLTTTWLEALGNAASPGVLPAANRYLRHADDAVRAAAVAALRDVESAEAVAALVATATGDAAAAVRSRAAEALAMRRDAAALETVDRLLQREADEGVRRAALVALADRRGQLGVEPLLRRVAASDPSVELREVARRAMR